MKSACFGLGFSVLVVMVGCAGEDSTASGGDSDGSTGGGSSSGGAGATGPGSGGDGGAASGGSSTGGQATASGGAGGGMGGAGGGTGGGGGAGGADMCGGIGDACQGACPGGLTCQNPGPNGFCAPAASDCGGFAGKLCPASHPVCLYFTGADYGLCATMPDAECICKNAPNAVDC